MKPEGNTERRAWEVFWCAWVRRTGSTPLLVVAEKQRRRAQVASAIGHAGRETVGFLRNAREWSWVNAYVLSGLLMNTATEWAREGAVDPVELFTRLRDVGVQEQAMDASEIQWKRITDVILAGLRRPLPWESREQA